MSVTMIVAALISVTNVLAERYEFRSFTNTGGLPSGIQVDSLTLNMGYFGLFAPSSAVPNNGNLPLGSVFGIGAGVKLGWYLRGSRSDFEIQYGAEYNAFTRYRQLRGVDQFLSVIFRRKVTPKLEWDFFAQGQSTRLSELVFAPSSTLSIVQGAGNINDLSGAISTGASSDVGLNPIAVGASGLDSPFMLAVSDSRLYLSSLATAVLYSATPRLLWFGHVQASVLWYRQDHAGIDQTVSLLRPYQDVASSWGFAYLLGKGTQLGFDVGYDRSHSAYYDANAVGVALSLTHHFGARWLMSGRVGPGAIVMKSVGEPSTRSEGYNAGGTIGYKGLAHTVMLSGQRSVSGRFGLGEDHTAGSTLVWSWQDRGSPWTLSGSLAYERLGGGRIRQLQGWLASVSAARRLTSRTSIVAEFVNASNSAPTVGALNGITRRAARITVVWSPSARNGNRRLQ